MRIQFQRPVMEPGSKISIIMGTIFVCAFLFNLFPFLASAHPGRTAVDGCHYCRTNCGKWGVPWNARHCHNGAAVPISTPSSQTVTPQFSETNTIKSVKNEIKNSESEYNNNHHWFRENLIDKLIEKFKIDKSLAAFYVYTMLPDKK